MTHPSSSWVWSRYSAWPTCFRDVVRTTEGDFTTFVARDGGALCVLDRTHMNVCSGEWRSFKLDKIVVFEDKWTTLHGFVDGVEVIKVEVTLT